ncbi:MAG: tRNA (adenosine(37)-N6)-dimethylallyltransferase MiaA, partial [Muribaculaceae bacterium]|nr:tRNA (adenosine(37)-N6)-dimethylallyltransferase MiaA [Muribaculaceae bacterium]
ITAAPLLGIPNPPDPRRKTKTHRPKPRLDNGMLDEIRTLLDSGISPDDLIYYGLEYKYLTLHVIGQLTFNEMFEKLEMEIHRFAKRQMTWFRGMERRGFKINWLDYNLPDEEFEQSVMQLLKDFDK